MKRNKIECYYCWWAQSKCASEHVDCTRQQFHLFLNIIIILQWGI